MVPVQFLPVGMGAVLVFAVRMVPAFVMADSVPLRVKANMSRMTPAFEVKDKFPLTTKLPEALKTPDIAPPDVIRLL
jgi:hypothetical protein